MNKEETEETKGQDKDTNQRVKQLDQALLLIPATMAAYQWGAHAGNRWHLVMLVVLALGIQA